MADPPPPPPQGLGSPAAWASPLPPPGSPSERRGIAGGAGLSQRLGAASPLSTSLLRLTRPAAPVPPRCPRAGEGAWPRSASSGSRSLPRLEPLSPSVSPTGRSRGSGGGASLAELPPDDGRAGPPPLPALRAWASPKGAGPGLSSPGAGGGGTGAYPPPLHSSDGESALARFQRGVAQVRPQLQQSDPNAATARGPVKWAPHFHSNPKHAKFCFLCLHSRLHGAQQAASEETSSGAASDDDLPPPAELQRLGYLHSGSAGSSFRREPVDFEQGNVAATWLRWVQDRAYVSLVKPFIAEHNSRQSCGNDVGLVFHHEEEKDRDVLAGIFSLTERQEVNVHLRLEKLGRWCASRETGLMDVMPEPARRPPLPHVEPLGQSQLEVLRYRPLLDADLLRGSSGRAAREAARAADASAGRLGAEGPPRPATSPSAPEAEILAFPLTADLVPQYEPWLPRAPRRRPVDASVDPLERPFLSLPSFAEGVMPQFGTGGGLARARPPRPAPVPEECLSQTFSLFEDHGQQRRAAGASPVLGPGAAQADPVGAPDRGPTHAGRPRWWSGPASGAGWWTPACGTPTCARRRGRRCRRCRRVRDGDLQGLQHPAPRRALLDEGPVARSGLRGQDPRHHLARPREVLPQVPAAGGLRRLPEVPLRPRL
ncbi:unnamed protein product [Prorocentrum cordatum]|uniref:Uncharacterized protein n=1 Tax=Prorocentrum cordatum TaxID=2364126 RepID=A0ABN9X8J2_9DINO|nr:unnamed protein product [Polarella glacialis]